jgi:hypothetical protein
MPSKTPKEIISEAEALLRQVDARFAETKEKLRASRADPHKIMGAMSEARQAQAQAEAQALFEQDQRDVEREVAEEAARLRFAAPPAAKPGGGARKPRNMI